jgi:hypothetical protein
MAFELASETVRDEKNALEMTAIPAIIPIYSWLESAEMVRMASQKSF